MGPGLRRDDKKKLAALTLRWEGEGRNFSQSTNFAAVQLPQTHG